MNVGVLESGLAEGDFESSDDLYEAIGPILHEVSIGKTETNIKDLCEQMLCLMKPSDTSRKGVQKVLDAPIDLAKMAEDFCTDTNNSTSIWVINRDDNFVSKTSTSPSRVDH